MSMLREWMKRIVAGAALMMVVGAPALAATEKADMYPLDTCPVSGKKLGSMGEAVVKVYDGREVRFCCDGCPANFEKDQAASLAKLDQAIIDAQSKDYPLTTCINSGKDLGASPASFVIGNRLVKTCCGNCQKKVEASEAEFLEKHAAAIVEKESAAYPSKTCPVSGEELGKMGEPVNIVIGNKLVKLCCASCEKTVAKDPAKQVNAVWGAASSEAEAPAAAPESKPKGAEKRNE
ncbi:MAG: hypothetical protein HYV26_05995 [Candidatus Hydrogenedentes bacterium]|nr:hypothetical protein [Candidatus Hydrogenedentota bacterium]MBI3119202.1 hypothetical protein [Candidatus Hydrogenedentota bacterium]